MLNQLQAIIYYSITSASSSLNVIRLQYFSKIDLLQITAIYFLLWMVFHIWQCFSQEYSCIIKLVFSKALTFDQQTASPLLIRFFHVTIFHLPDCFKVQPFFNFFEPDRSHQSFLAAYSVAFSIAPITTLHTFA